MTTNPRLQPLFLLSDEPIRGHDRDFLTRNDDAKTIAEAVLGATGPFSVGIYSEWGTGKTSLLNHVKSLLEAPHPDNNKHLAYPYLVTVAFNAWQHEKDEEPLAHLAEAVDAAITKRLAVVSSLTDTVLRAPVEWLRSAHLAARSLIYGAAIESRLDPTDALVESRGWRFWKRVPIFKFSAKDAIDRYEKLQREAGDQNSRAWKDHIKQSVSRSVLRSFQANSDLLDEVRLDEERRIPRVVIFIDDMDRCTPEDAFRLLQAIKLAMAQPGFIFVMTLDPIALQPFLEKKVSDAGLAASKDSKAIYLDKLVQLPVRLRLNDEQFKTFVDKIINLRLKDMLPASQWEVFASLAIVLEVSSQKNPRTLIRRINGLLVDARIASATIKSTLDTDTAKAEGIFMGLCLIRDTLKQFLGVAETKQLSDTQPLCTLIKDRGLTRCYKRMAAVTGGNPIGERTTPLAEGESAQDEAGDTELTQGRELLQEMNRRPWLDDLFKTDAGQRWLASKDERDLVETFYAKRPEETVARPQPTPAAAVVTVPKADAAPLTQTEVDQPTEAPVEATEPVPAAPSLPDKERQIIERAIRGALDLPANAPLGPAEFARVTQLDLRGDPISDAGAAWLAHPATDLKALTTLSLFNTKITDAGAATLAAPNSGLKAVTTLSLGATQITDAGAAALAAPNSGLTALTTLNLRGTQITDAGAAALAAPDSGLKALTALYLSATQITDAGAAKLAAPESGLTALTTLDLAGTKITDAAAATLAAPNSGLTALISLDLRLTKITDAGAAKLAAPDSGLKALTTLDLGGTQITDAAAAALAAPNSGLTALTTLFLGATQITNAGAAVLAAPNSGLKALKTLDLRRTKVTSAGIAKLKAARPNLTVYHD